MTEREKNEICKGYADLIIKKEKLYRDWETEFTIKKIEDILTRNRIIKPTETEEASETEPKTS